MFRSDRGAILLPRRVPKTNMGCALSAPAYDVPQIQQNLGESPSQGAKNIVFVEHVRSRAPLTLAAPTTSVLGGYKALHHFVCAAW